jgi:hypothetical protein
MGVFYPELRILPEKRFVVLGRKHGMQMHTATFCHTRATIRNNLARTLTEKMCEKYFIKDLCKISDLTPIAKIHLQEILVNRKLFTANFLFSNKIFKKFPNLLWSTRRGA